MTPQPESRLAWPMYMIKVDGSAAPVTGSRLLGKARGVDLPDCPANSMPN